MSQTCAPLQKVSLSVASVSTNTTISDNCLYSLGFTHPGAAHRLEVERGIHGR